MSVVIVGGNECMECQYKDLCKQYNLKAKVYTKTKGPLKDRIGCPDLLVLFTNTVSHKMVKCSTDAVKGRGVKIVRCHSSSMAALRDILENHTAEVAQGR